MEHFPGAVPEIPVSDVDTAAAYYKNQLGFRPVICHLTRISFPFEVRIQASRSSTFRVGRSDLWLCGCFFGALPELLVVCIYERHCQSYLGARVDRLWTCNARLVPLHGTAKFMPL